MASRRTKWLSYLFGLSAVALAIEDADAYGRVDMNVAAPRHPLDHQMQLFAQSTPTVTYTYDGGGRSATSLYTDQTCVVYKYDANGNRIAVAVTKADVPETNVWGSGAYGCSKWAPP